MASSAPQTASSIACQLGCTNGILWPLIYSVHQDGYMLFTRIAAGYRSHQMDFYGHYEWGDPEVNAWYEMMKREYEIEAAAFTAKNTIKAEPAWGSIKDGASFSGILPTNGMKTPVGTWDSFDITRLKRRKT